MRKKILFFSTLYYPQIIGGAERIAQFLAEGLLESQYEPVVITTKDKNAIDQSATEEEYVNKVKVYRLNLENIYYPFRYNDIPSKLQKLIWHVRDIENRKMGKKIRALLDREKPALVCTHNLTGFSDVVWKIVKQRHLPLVHILHDYYQLCPKSTMYNNRVCNGQCMICKLFSIRKKMFSANVDAVVGVSKFVLSKHLELGYFKKTRVKSVIYNAIKLQDEVVSNSSFVVGGKLKLGYIGGLLASKGIEVLLQAVNNVANERIEVFIAGRAEDSYLRYLKETYFADNVHYLGFIKPEDFFKQIDILVVPSIWNEPLATVIIEALFYLKPVIGSNVGGTPELIEDGSTGVLVKPNDVASLTRAISNFVQDPSLIVAMQAGIIEKRKLFSLQEFIVKYVNLFDSFFTT